MLGFSDIKQAQNDNPTIRVIGIGGGGGNAINRMVTMMDTQTVEFVAANTDLQDLRNSAATYKLQLGVNCTKGLGAGAKPQVGREAVLENSDLVREFVSGADMVFITAGMGGGTGTGGAPIVAQIAREIEALTVGVVTLPFRFEGKHRRKNAEKGIEELKDHVDTLIVIPNDNLLGLVNKRTSMVEAFKLADDVLRQAIQGISDLITNEGIINLDFADVRTVMQNGGKAVMGVGIAAGENRATAAAEQAIHSPLLSDHKITGSQGILVNMVGGNTLTMHEINEAACFIQEQAHEEATIIWGASIRPDQEDQIQITVIATGFGKDGTLTEQEINRQKLDLLKEDSQPDSNADHNSSVTSSLNSTNLSVSLKPEIVSDQTGIEEQEADQPTAEIVKTSEEGEFEFPLSEIESVEVQKEEDVPQEADQITSEIVAIPEETEVDHAEHNPIYHDTEENQTDLETAQPHPLSIAGSAHKLEKLSVSSLDDGDDSRNKINASTQAFTLKTVEELAAESIENLDRAAELAFMEEHEDERSLAKANAEIAVETSPRYPDWALRKRHRRDFTSDLDIPTFIRRRAKKLGKDFR